MASVGIFGAGYVGLVTGACLAELGHRVTVRDVVPERIEALRAGEVPIYEPGLDELLERNGERLRFTLDVGEAIEGAEFLYICVGTPPTYSGDADLSAVWTVIDELPRAGTQATVVMKSTVPPGTGEKVRAALDARGLEHVGYVSNPEFTAEGTAVRDFMRPDRIVIGSFEDAHGAAVEALHEGIDAPVVRTDVTSAEMVKLASNAFLMTRISFINEIANVCEATGADVEQVAKGVGLNRRLGPHFLRAGIGYGGSCLVGDGTVYVQENDRTLATTLERVFSSLHEDELEEGIAIARPEDLRVLSWRVGADRAEFLPVASVTRRPYCGEIYEVKVGGRARVGCTPDHPLVLKGSIGCAIRLASELEPGDLLPATPIWQLQRGLRREGQLVGTTAGGPTSSVSTGEGQDVSLGGNVHDLAVTGEPITDISRKLFDGFVYSLEVPESETFVTTGGVVVHNCFPKDGSALKQLAANSGYHFQLLNAVIEVNELQKRRVVAKLKKFLGSLRGKQIALLGLAFKPNTDDLREAPSIVLASRLLAEGAEVRAWDPIADASDLLTGVTFASTPLEAVQGAHAAVIVTEWEELRTLTRPEIRAAMANPLIVDGRNFLDPVAARAAGFLYEGIGRAASPLGALPETEEYVTPARLRR